MRLFFSRLACAALAAIPLGAQPASVDWLLQARYVVTMDDRHRIIEQGAVAITGSHIVAVGTQAELGARYEAKQTLDRSDALLAPGLIDTHTHAPMSLLRGLAEDKVLR